MKYSDTKQKILDSAEYFFSEEGYAGASLRSISNRAGVNLAAANYHFGSKRALLEAVFERRLRPLNEARLTSLDDYLSNLPEHQPPEVECLISIFLEPVLKMYRHDEQNIAQFMRLLAHMFNAPSEEIREIFYQQFQTIKARFLMAFSKACPELDHEEIFWRFVFMIGAMAHTLTMMHDLPKLKDNLDISISVDEMEHRLIPFIAAGWNAPSPKLQKMEG